MATQFIEEILTLVKTAVSGGIGAKLTAITAEKADGVSLPAPIAYFICEQDSIADYPAIEIIGDSTDTLIPGGTWDEDEHKVIIKLHNVSYEGSIEQCAKRSYRYARAIAELILDNRTLTNNVISFYRTMTNYQPMMTDGNGFKQEIWVHCNIKHHTHD